METLSKHFRTLTKVSFERHGFAQADLLSSWATIAGNELAGLCKPEKLKWPKAQGAARKEGGTLVLRTEPGRAVDVHYATPQLIERINRFFGYEAVTSVQVKQSMTPRFSKPLDTPLPPPMVIDGVADEALRDALARLGQNVQGTQRFPQVK
jgi:hypothetical protein